MTGRTWALCFDGERPWSTNGDRNLHPMARHRKIQQWRSAFAALAREANVPPLAAVRVRAWPLAKNRRSMQDVGGCLPAVKAAVDGLVDAGVLVDDGPGYLRELVFTGAEIGDLDGLMLIVEELG